MINYLELTVGQEYSRPSLAKLWGYKSFNAISRGVFSPKNEKVLVLFITKEKQESLTQYIDHIDADILFWEGENGHGNDERIISRQDTILVFYRDRHHSDFIYKGRAALRSYYLLNDSPSKFTFDLIDHRLTIKDMVAEINQNYGIPETERLALINSRRGQGIYRNRAIDLWKTCSVTGFTESTLLIASHIKPWKVSSNDERLNPFNSLLLVPTLDKLFDNGYIGFEQNGSMLMSSKIKQQDWDRIGISTKMKLRNVPGDSKTFLEYHREYIFNLGTEIDAL